MPHVEDVVNHAVIAQSITPEHPLHLLDQASRISVEQKLMFKVGLQGSLDLLPQISVIICF